MNKQDIFGTVLKFNGIDLPKAMDFHEFTLTSLREYPFDSSIITCYRMTHIPSNKILDFSPENLFKELSNITELFAHDFN